MSGSHRCRRPSIPVSIESGLEGRNNLITSESPAARKTSLNRVRPRRPEQFGKRDISLAGKVVSIESGLEGRNNEPDASGTEALGLRVSIESGLEGRNNLFFREVSTPAHLGSQ